MKAQVRRLIASLSEPETMPVMDLMNALRDEIAGNEVAGRDWIAATREVQASGKLSADEADTIICDVAGAVMNGAADRDDALGRLAKRLAPLHERQRAAWRRQPWRTSPSRRRRNFCPM